MRRLALLALLAAAPALMQPAAAATRSCHDAAADAERAYGIPPGLLDAIGHIESGRFDPASGRVDAWPFAYNVAGQGHFAADAATAVAEVGGLQLAGNASIDVGCFQINLLYHPGAFASLADGFDPDANAQAAARFLVQLHARTGGWDSAVAMYHSAAPERGEPYRQMVMADWQGVPRAGLAASWGGGRVSLAPAAPVRADPYTVLMSHAAAAVQVFRPLTLVRLSFAPASVPVGGPARPVPVAAPAQGRLPRVYTPSWRG